MEASRTKTEVKNTFSKVGYTLHSKVDAVIEMSEHAHKALDSSTSYIEKGNKALKITSGVIGYKNYSWIKNAPIKTVNGLNSVKRAVIINRGWKFIHDITILNAEKLEKFDSYLEIAAVVIELAKTHDKFMEITRSNDNTSLKAQRYLALGRMSVFKTVGAPIVPTAHLLSQSIVKACALSHSPYGSLATSARAVDIAVESSYIKLMDSDNVVNYINSHLVIK